MADNDQLAADRLNIFNDMGGEEYQFFSGRSGRTGCGNGPVPPGPVLRVGSSKIRKSGFPSSAWAMPTALTLTAGEGVDFGAAFFRSG